MENNEGGIFCNHSSSAFLVQYDDTDINQTIIQFGSVQCEVVSSMLKLVAKKKDVCLFKL